MAQLHATRVDSFVFFLVSRNTKLYETGHCFAEFRSFREIRNKMFRETEKTFRFVVSHIFIEILCLLFEFRTFHSSLVPLIRFLYLLFKCCTFFELHRYLLDPSIAITTFIGRFSNKLSDQERRDAGKKEIRTGWIQEKRDTGK